MLLTPQNMESLEKCEYIVTEKDKVVEILATCDEILFFDTCLMSKIYLFDRMEDILKYMEEVHSESIVVVFTETLLSELTAYTTGGSVSKKLMRIFQKISVKYQVVYFKEEWLIEWRMQLVDEDISTLNQHFKDIFKKYKSLLPKLDSYADDKSASFYSILFGIENVSASSTFGEEVISTIKSKKKNGDSLAELLVFLCVLYVMDLYENDYGEFSFFFLTADRKAAAKVKALQNHSDLYLRVFAFYTVGVLTKDMMDGGIFANNDEIKEFVMQMLGLHTYHDMLKIRIHRKGALDIREEQISINELVNIMTNESETRILY